MILNPRSRNFSLKEILHHGDINNPLLREIGMYQMGYMQAMRDHASKAFPKHLQGFRITSGARNGYNDSVKGAAENSHHIWRVDDKGYIHSANDWQPIGVGRGQMFQFIRSHYRGELYENVPEDIIHTAPVATEDESWVKR